MFLGTDSSRKRICYSRTEGVDSSTRAHYNLTFWSVWPSSLSQTLPPFVALGPLWQCIDSLRCINPSDTGWMDSCWQDAPCHFVCCHLIRAPQFALLLSSPAHAHWGQVLSDITDKVSCTFAINCSTKESKFPESGHFGKQSTEGRQTKSLHWSLHTVQRQVLHKPFWIKATFQLHVHAR